MIHVLTFNRRYFNLVQLVEIPLNIRSLIQSSLDNFIMIFR